MERLGSKMIEMHKVSKAFKENIILDQFDYNFQRNDRIGIIGKNGTGKSTLLNLLESFFIALKMFINPIPKFSRL